MAAIAGPLATSVAITQHEARMRTYPALAVRPLNPSAEFLELLAATLDDYGLLALEDDDAGAMVRAFFADGTERTAAAAAVESAFPGVEVHLLEVPDENWAERSQASLKAVRVGALLVAPPWDSAAQESDATVIILPSMGFGTGHHATTRLSLLALQNAEPAGKSVLDVGTGSGVLALAAAKLGASYVLGFDNDPDAIDNARENMALNGLSVDFRCRGLEDLPLLEAPFDLVSANLTGGMLIRVARRLERLAGQHGRLILSGLREEEEHAVKEAFRGGVEARSEEEGWICVVLRSQA